MTSTGSSASTLWPQTWEFVQRIPVRVAAVGAATLVALLCWAFASPVGSAPDDDFHIANVYCIHDATSCRSDDIAWPADYVGFWPPALADRNADPSYRPAKEAYPDLWAYDQPRKLPCFVLNSSTRYAPDASVPADCLSDEDQTSNRPQTLDQLDYYPSVYYRVLSVFTQDTIRESVAAWRIVVSVLALLTALASIALSLPSWRRPLTVAWLVSSVPLGMFLLSSHNPSATTIIGAAAAVGPGVALLQRRTSSSGTVLRLLLVGFSLLLMVGGRTEGLLFAAVAVMLILLLGLRHLSIRTTAVVVALAITLALVLWLVFPSLSEKLGPDIDAAPRQALWDILARSAEILTGSYNYPLGWVDITMPALVTVAAGAAFWGTIMLGIATFTWRKALAIATVAVALLGSTMALYIIAGEAGQVRYRLPLIYLLVIAALAPAGRRALPDWGRAQWWALCICLAVSNSVALLYVTVRYVSGLNPGTVSPQALAAAPTPDWWWGAWLGPFSNWLVGSLAFVAVLGLLPSLLMRVEREGTDSGAPSQDPPRHRSAPAQTAPALHATRLGPPRSPSSRQRNPGTN